MCCNGEKSYLKMQVTFPFPNVSRKTIPDMVYFALQGEYLHPIGIDYKCISVNVMFEIKKEPPRRTAS